MNREEAKSRAAVIDVGSNTIKILLGEKSADGIRIILDRAVECRISQGMYSSPPRFRTSAMEAAASSVEELIAAAREYSPEVIEVIATSAVRDAENRAEFATMIQNRAGCHLLTLSGREEAEGIAQGIEQEPILSTNCPYSVSDLGGGSLEWIFRRNGKITQMESMELGAVRLMSRFVPDPSKPLTAEERSTIRAYCSEIFQTYLNSKDLPSDAIHWGTGGAFTITRLLLAKENGLSLSDQTPVIHYDDLLRIESVLSAMTLSERAEYPGLPATRADILPVALNIILSLADFFGIRSFRHSFFNLRMGRLARLLGIL